MVRGGETRPLMLSNRAIVAYKKYRHRLALVSPAPRQVAGLNRIKLL